MREPPEGPEGVRSTEPKAKPVRWRPCEAGARPNWYELSHTPKIAIHYSVYLFTSPYRHAQVILPKNQP